MIDFQGNELCVGDRVIFCKINNKGLAYGQITSFAGEDPNRCAVIMSDGKRETMKHTHELIKESLND